MQATKVFFRDDDVGVLSDSLRAFFDVLIEHGIPCHYQVVPDYLDADSAAELRLLKRAHPTLIHFNQHGLHHEQLLAGRSAYSEFAGGRAYEDQRADIAEGRAVLERLLGDAFEADVFTPPCHKYDAETIRALGDLGFEMLSAGVRIDRASKLYYAVGRLLGRVDFLGKRVSYHGRLMPDTRLAEVSVVLDVHEAQDARGDRIDKSAEMLWQEFEAARAELEVVGIMTHHQACETPAKQKAFREFVARLAADPGVDFVDMLDLMPVRGAR